MMVNFLPLQGPRSELPGPNIGPISINCHSLR